MNPLLPVAVLFSASIMWGLTWLPMKYFNNAGIEGIPLILVAYGVVALACLPVLWRQRRQWMPRPQFIVLTFVLGGFANLAFASALIYGDVVRVMVLFYLLPAWGVIGGRLFLGEHIDHQRKLSVVLALVGAFLILGGFTIFEQPPTYVDLLAITSGMAFAMNNICFRASQDVPVPSKVAAMFIGCALFAALLLVGGVQTMPGDIAALIWAGLALFGLGWLLLATTGTQWGVTHMEAGRSSIIIIIELVTAVISAAIVAGEIMKPIEWMGGLLILSAAFLEAWRPNEPVGELETSPGR